MLDQVHGGAEPLPVRSTRSRLAHQGEHRTAEVRHRVNVGEAPQRPDEERDPLGPIGAMPDRRRGRWKSHRIQDRVHRGDPRRRRGRLRIRRRRRSASSRDATDTRSNLRRARVSSAAERTVSASACRARSDSPRSTRSSTRRRHARDARSSRSTCRRAGIELQQTSRSARSRNGTSTSPEDMDDVDEPQLPDDLRHRRPAGLRRNDHHPAAPGGEPFWDGGRPVVQGDDDQRDVVPVAEQFQDDARSNGQPVATWRGHDR